MKSLALALVAIVIFAWGCEDRRSSDAIEQAAAAKAKSAEPVSARPTTQEQYEGDKQLLNAIVESLAYDPTAAPATQP